MSQLELITLMGCDPPVTHRGCWTRVRRRCCCPGEFPGQRAEDRAEGMPFACAVDGGVRAQRLPFISVFSMKRGKVSFQNRSGKLRERGGIVGYGGKRTERVGSTKAGFTG